MFCNKCGVEIIEGSSFCHKCGKAVAVLSPPVNNIQPPPSGSQPAYSNVRPQQPPVNAAPPVYSQPPQQQYNPQYTYAPPLYAGRPPRKPGSEGLAKTIVNLTARGVSIALLLAVFICSFFTSFKMDLGDIDPSMRGVEIKQSSLQIISAAFSKYDKGEYEDVLKEMQGELSAFAPSSYYGLTSGDKKELSVIMSRYNWLKLTASEIAVYADEKGLPAPKEAPYTFGVYAAALLGVMIISFAALALFAVDLLLYILSLSNGGKKKKHDPLFWKSGVLLSLLVMLFAALFTMFVPSGANAGNAVILPLIFCPVIFILAYAALLVFEYKAFNVKRFVLQTVSLLMCIITISVFTGSSAANVKASYGENGKKIYIIKTTPYDFTCAIDLITEYTSKDVIKSLPDMLADMTPGEKDVISAVDLMTDEAYFNTYKDLVALYKALSYVYLAVCVMSLAFVGLTASSMLFNNESKKNKAPALLGFLSIVPLVLMFLGFTGFLVGGILMKTSLTETFKFLTLSKTFKASIGGGPIAAMVLSLFATMQFFVLKEKKPKPFAPQIQAALSTEQGAGTDN